MTRSNDPEQRQRRMRIPSIHVLGCATLALLATGCMRTPVKDTRVGRAESYERVGSWPEASVVWTEIYLASNASNTDAGYRAARASFAAGRFAEARIRLVDLARRAPKDARVFELSGQTSEVLGDAEGARAAYRTALDLDADLPLSSTRLGALLVAAGDVEAGMEWLQKGLELDPEDGRAQYAYGLAAHAAGDRDLAILAFGAACASDAPSDQERLEAARMIGADARVADWLEPVVKHDPQWTEALWRLGEARALGGRFTRGLALLERAAESDPGDVAALAAYARGLVGAARIDEATAIIEHARSLDLTPEEQALIAEVEAEIGAEPAADVDEPAADSAGDPAGDDGKPAADVSPGR